MLLDSLSVISQLSEKRKSYETAGIVANPSELRLGSFNLIFQWVLGHMGLKGNSTVDKLAKRGLSSAKRGRLYND